MTRLKSPIPGAYVRFYLPLALMAVAQALTHPLVATVAARAPGGALNVAGLAQSNLVTLLLQTLAFGLLTAGMTFGRTRKGFAVFVRLTVVITGIITVLHGLLALGGPSHMLFGRLIGLPPAVEKPAAVAFAAGIPVRILFQLRIPLQAALFNARQSGRAGVVALIRIVITLALAPLFVRAGLVGVFWATICLTIPVVLEGICLWVMARRVITALPEGIGAPPTFASLVAFTMPLSFGATLMVLSGNVLGAFVARGVNPEAMLSVYHLGLSVAGPLAYAANQTQRVVLAFAPESLTRRRAAVFGATTGALTGLLSLALLMGPLQDFYYVGLQALPPEELPALRVAVLLLAFYPFAVGLRSAAEGSAAYLKRPMAVMLGYLCYLVVILVFGVVSLRAGVAGNVLGPIGMSAGNLTAGVVVAVMLSASARRRSKP